MVKDHTARRSGSQKMNEKRAKHSPSVALNTDADKARDDVPG
jgi:hypothetical protein